MRDGGTKEKRKRITKSGEVIGKDGNRINGAEPYEGTQERVKQGKEREVKKNDKEKKCGGLEDKSERWDEIGQGSVGSKEGKRNVRRHHKKGQGIKMEAECRAGGGVCTALSVN